MVTKRPGIVRPRDLDYLVDRYSRRGCLTTGDVANILQLSPNNTQESGRLKGFLYSKVPGSKHIRFTVGQLVTSLKSRWGYFGEQYPQQLLLHFMEVVGLDPKQYGLDGLAGIEGLRVHVQQTLYSTGEASTLINKALQTVIRWVDKGILEGYRNPNAKFRKIPARAIARYIMDNKIGLEGGLNIPNCPEIITFPDPFPEYGKGSAGWDRGSKVVGNPDKKSIWYRQADEIHEVSIRKNERYGLYIKLDGIDKADPRIDLILLGRAGRLGSYLLPQKDHLERIYELLEMGLSLFDAESQNCEAFNVVSKAKDRFKDVYFRYLMKHA